MSKELDEIFRQIKSIAFHMQPEGRRIMFADLNNRLETLRSAISPQDQRDVSEPLARKFDVLLLTVTNKELDAVTRTFKIKTPSAKPSDNLNGIRLWYGSVTSSSAGRPLSILVGSISVQGNLSSHIVTQEILRKYEVGLAVLCGIAAGNKNEISIYCAVVADHVTYYELQRLSENGPEMRFKPIPVHAALERDLEVLCRDDMKRSWTKVLNRRLGGVRKAQIQTRVDVDDELKNWKSELRVAHGNIFSGEKLLADGKTLQALADAGQISKDTLAGEMEGYGFAYACANRNVKWMIFRGISDFGGTEKSKESNKKLQFIAAESAAALAYVYLTNVYQG